MKKISCLHSEELKYQLIVMNLKELMKKSEGIPDKEAEARKKAELAKEREAKEKLKRMEEAREKARREKEANESGEDKKEIKPEIDDDY